MSHLQKRLQNHSEGDIGDTAAAELRWKDWAARRERLVTPTTRSYEWHRILARWACGRGSKRLKLVVAKPGALLLHTRDADLLPTSHGMVDRAVEVGQGRRPHGDE